MAMFDRGHFLVAKNTKQNGTLNELIEKICKKKYTKISDNKFGFLNLNQLFFVY